MKIVICMRHLLRNKRYNLFFIVFLSIFSFLVSMCTTKERNIIGYWSIDAQDGSLVNRYSAWGIPSMMIQFDKDNSILLPTIIWSWQVQHPYDSMLVSLSEEQRLKAHKITAIMNDVPLETKGKWSIISTHPDSIMITANHPLSGRYAFYIMQRDAYWIDGWYCDFDWLVLSNDSSYICMKRVFQKLH